MQAKKRASRILRLMVACAFLTASSIVLGKYLAVNLSDVLRFSFENLPIVLAGVAFGPVAGAAVGVVADLLGCVLVGFGVNPLVTIGAALIGAIAGIFRYLFNRPFNLSSMGNAYRMTRSASGSPAVLMNEASASPRH